MPFCFFNQEGDRISLIRKSNGTLHYFINGVDQGMASNSCPTPVWGVVDLYGMAVKVTILDRNDPNYCHVFINRPQERRSIFQQFPDMYDEETAEGRDKKNGVPLYQAGPLTLYSIITPFDTFEIQHI